MKLVCPHCNSENVESCPIVYESMKETTAEKEIPAEIAPPKKTYRFSHYLAIACSLIGLGWSFSIHDKLLFIFFGVILGFRNKIGFNKKEYLKSYREWLYSYICSDCKHKFVKKVVCPRCDSENVESCELVYENMKKTTPEKEIPAEIAPPKKLKENFRYLGIACPLFALISLGAEQLVLAAIFIAIAFGILVRFKKESDFNKKDYPLFYREWQKSYICHDCKHKFVRKTVCPRCNSEDIESYSSIYKKMENLKEDTPDEEILAKKQVEEWNLLLDCQRKFSFLAAVCWVVIFLATIDKDKDAGLYASAIVTVILFIIFKKERDAIKEKYRIFNEDWSYSYVCNECGRKFVDR